MNVLEDSEVLTLAASMLKQHGITDWNVKIVPQIAGVGAAGFTYQGTKIIELAQEYWPTDFRNIHELLRHEIAHVLVGHGDHNDEWREKLTSMGGTFVWIRDDGTESSSPEI